MANVFENGTSRRGTGDPSGGNGMGNGMQPGYKPPTFSGEPARRMEPVLGSFKEGTDHVPATGAYKLHEGEKVVPKDKNMKDVKDKMQAALSDEDGKDGKKGKKAIHKIEIHKSHNGKIIAVHKHHPPHHTSDHDTEHALNDMAELHDHMEAHAGTPNEGEEAPQGGQPPQLSASPSPAPEPAPMPGQ